jgi:probable F420-dependent oxidoreductase
MTDDVWADAGEARRQLGTVGVWSGLLGTAPWPQAREAASRIEGMGYGALWLNESPVAREPFTTAALLLSATDRIPCATGIANIWVRDATAARNATLALAEAYPGRFTLGLGVSHKPLVDSRGHDYGRPLAAMRDYLDAMDGAGGAAVRPATAVPRVLAALRPRMLELARDRATGAHPYFVPVEHTARARDALGPDRFLGPELAIVLETDPTRARDRARRYTSRYLELPNYTNALRALGYGDDDLTGTGSDRLVDAIVAWGDEDAIARRVREHREAGADHVCVQPVATDLAGSLQELERLAPALLER